MPAVAQSLEPAEQRGELVCEVQLDPEPGRFARRIATDAPGFLQESGG